VFRLLIILSAIMALYIGIWLKIASACVHDRGGLAGEQAT